MPATRGGHLPERSGTGRIDDHERRVADLERARPPVVTTIGDLADHKNNQGTPAGHMWRYDYVSGMYLPAQTRHPFSQPGAVTVGSSGPMDLEYDGMLILLRARLGTAGTSNTVLTVTVNGTVEATLTLGSGVPSGEIGLAPPVYVTARTDELEVNVTAAGTGADHLSGYVLA